MIRLCVFVLSLVVALQPALAQQEIDLPTRPGVKQPVYLTEVPSPVATVVLFPGGIGLVSAVRNNFLLRVAPRFAAAQMTVAIADAPSDHSGGMDRVFRATDAHAQDIAAIVAMLRSRSPAPVWLVGTSNGSISAANGAVHIGPPAVSGVVLTSSVWSDGMERVPLSALRVPVLIVHTREDGCRISPYAGAERAFASLSMVRVREFLTISGGRSISAPCEARSPHGYLGIEDQVVPPVIAWIKAH